jgi:hypothetical protein
LWRYAGGEETAVGNGVLTLDQVGQHDVDHRGSGYALSIAQQYFDTLLAVSQGDVEYLADYPAYRNFALLDCLADDIGELHDNEIKELVVHEMHRQVGDLEAPPSALAPGNARSLFGTLWYDTV